jgi:hypothetical protein
MRRKIFYLYKNPKKRKTNNKKVEFLF